MTTAMAANKKAASAPGAETRSNIGGGGLNLSKPGENNPNPIQHGGMGQAERAFSAASTFLSGLLAISASQFIGAPLKLVDPKFYDGYMAWTKESFAVLMTTITQWWSPTVIRVGGDESMKGQLYVMDDGTLKCNFPHRLVLMANHQLYTDWMYLWWIAYTNKMHGRIYIILKESLKNLPIFGWGAQFYNFIFLSRKWETDRYRFKRALNHLKNPQDPMWLLIFPEGTNLSAVTREKSKAWSNKAGIQDMKHQLLPRTTGLQFCLQELRQTTNWLYDCTIAYEGVPKGMYGQDIFTLRSSFFEGRPPKSVNMYWRRFRISEIPVDNDQAFARWLNNRWREKDYILEYFYKYAHFPAMDAVTALAAAEGKKEPRHAKMITSEVRGGGWDEFLSIFGPITSAAGALGQVDLTDPVNFDKLMAKVAETQQLNLMNLGKAPIAATSQEAIRNALQAANAQKALPKSVIDALMKDTPTTQQGMQQALQKAGNPEVAKKAAQAPATKASISGPTQQAAAKATSQIQQNTSTPRVPTRKAASVSSMPVGAEASNHRTKSKPSQSPLASARRAMPLANPEAMVTRPLTTMAMQTATSTARNALAQRTKEKGTALPGQGTKAMKQQSNGTSKTATTPAKPASVGQKPATQNVPLTAANLNAAAKQQKTSGSKPLGTQKYVNGKKVG